jgi:Ras-related protein Rab-32
MDEVRLDTKDDPNTIDIQFKVLVVGEPGVGKTSLIKRYVHGIFSNNYKATIGVDFALKRVQWNENIVINLQFWDLAGQERFGTQVRTYFREAVGAIVLYDITRPDTKDRVQAWKTMLDERVYHSTETSNIKIPCILMANKIDALDIDGNIDVTEIVRFSQDLGFVGGYPVSVKSASETIDTAVKHLIQCMLTNYNEAKADKNEAGFDMMQTVNLEPVAQSRSRGWCSC